MEQLADVAVSVVIAAALGAVLFLGTNVLVDQAGRRYPAFTSAMGAIVGLVVGAVAQHNGVFPSGLPGIVLGGLVGTALGAAWGRVRGPAVSRQDRIRRAERVRPAIFVGPALLFVGVGLVGPAIITIIISFRGGRSGDGAGTLEWYRTIFTDQVAGTNEYFNLDNFGSIFTSRLFIVAVVAVLAAAALAWSSAQRLAGGRQAVRAERVSRGIGTATAVLAAAAFLGLIEGIVREPNESAIFDVLTVLVSSRITLAVASLGLVAFAAWAVLRPREREQLDWGSPGSSLAVVGAIILVLFAFFSTLQAVIWNNLWWVTAVAGISTVLGLLLAILADRMRSNRQEVAAKALIFMPMAISMVGAAVIWDFVYERQPVGDQTGLLNAVLQAMGFQPRGFFVNASLIPWNNLFIIVIMIWIQTGFAMVILSAAIKGVPDELLEAARVDGAREVQVFWRVVIPQVRSTILVVVTTLVITVMKVFDLVKATTGGANRTNVLANEMFNELSIGNFAQSSAFAVVIFALIVPVMVLNIRRTAREVK
jgi:alpha-glucoside transport system permease protein